MLLIKKMGGSIEEQIAGLLHDVSHTAFSHVVDFVLDHPEENYHELIFNEVVRSSPIPQILEKYQCFEEMNQAYHGAKYGWSNMVDNLKKLIEE